MDLGTRLMESLLVEVDIMSTGTGGGAIDINTTGDKQPTTTKTPTTDSSERVFINKDKPKKRMMTRQNQTMREYTDEEISIVMEDWKTTVGGAVIGGATGAGISAAVWAKKRLALKKKMKSCDDLERGQIGPCREKVVEEIKALKKKALKYGAAATVAGAGIGAGGSALYQHLNKAPSINSNVKITAKAGQGVIPNAKVALPPAPPKPPKPQSVKPLLSMSATAGKNAGGTASANLSKLTPKSDTLKNAATSIASHIPKVSKTTKGAAAGAAIGGGGYYVMKKKFFRDQIEKLNQEKKACQDDDCRDWINDKIDRIREKEKDLKKKVLAATVAGAGAGAAAANAGTVSKKAWDLMHKTDKYTQILADKRFK